MAIIKCKMCGGDLALEAGSVIARCEYCGNVQTVPGADSEKKLALFERAERLRRSCDFDKAAGVYESIVAEFRQEAEAYWGLVLCTYGIEYVDDPATGKKIPTCHRSSYRSVLDDSNYELTLENADALARKLYRQEAKQIEELRKGIIAVSAAEAPYDIFICYKETAPDGQRTVDSVLAQDIYKALTREGYRVFFSRISLETRLGQEYEPYIFAALNSARVMLVVGTDYEYFNAVWVKNEWSRYIRLMEEDPSRHMIPCFKGVDAYDMPKEFAKLQAQDLGKVGAMQDLLHGIEKLLPRQTAPRSAPAQPAGANTKALLDRGIMALEDQEWAKADGFFEEVLNADAQNGVAYLGKALAQEQCRSLEALVTKRSHLMESVTPSDAKASRDPAGEEAAICQYVIPGFLTKEELRQVFAKFDPGYRTFVPNRKKYRDGESAWWQSHKNLSRAMQFADPRLKAQLQAALAKTLENMAGDIEQAKEWEKQTLAQVADRYRACGDKLKQLHEQRSQVRRELYERGVRAAETTPTPGNVHMLHKNVSNLRSMGDYRDSQALADKILRSIEAMEQRDRESAARTAAKKKRNRILILGLVAAVAIFAVVLFTVILPSSAYSDAEALLEKGDYDGAIAAFRELDDYDDSRERVREAYYKKAQAQLAAGDETQAIFTFGAAWGYQDAQDYYGPFWKAHAVQNTIAAGTDHSVAVQPDGTVRAAGDNSRGQCNVSGWENIVAVACGANHTVGLKADGTVVAVGDNYDGKCNLSGWENIVAIAAADNHTVGLKADGTVVAAGSTKYDSRCAVTGWENIVAIACGASHTVGLKLDGTVVSTPLDPGDSSDYGQCDVSGWKDIVAIAAGDYTTIGIRADGTAVAAGSDRWGQTQVGAWFNVKTACADLTRSAAVRKDGTVAVAGKRIYNLDTYTDVVDIAMGHDHTLILKADGTLVHVGTGREGQDEIDGWMGKLPGR